MLLEDSQANEMLVGLASLEVKLESEGSRRISLDDIDATPRTPSKTSSMQRAKSLNLDSPNMRSLEFFEKSNKQMLQVIMGTSSMPSHSQNIYEVEEDSAGKNSGGLANLMSDVMNTERSSSAKQRSAAINAAAQEARVNALRDLSQALQLTPKQRRRLASLSTQVAQQRMQMKEQLKALAEAMCQGHFRTSRGL